MKTPKLARILQLWHKGIIQTVLVLFLLSSALSFYPARSVSAASPVTYYLDCNGNDSNSGTSQALPWKTLTKANAANLLPGDQLLLKRGCTFVGTLNAYWSGTAAATIVISAYGSGALPMIKNAAGALTSKYYNAVDIQGTYLTIQYLEVTTVNPPVDPNCQNNPIGYFIGFNFRNPNNSPNGGSNNVLRYSKATHFTAGAQTNTNTHNDHILSNTFTDNYVMEFLTPTSVSKTDDIGAWGILIHGSKHEVGYNYLANNNAWCTYDTPPQGNSIELYEATNTTIHHNTSVNDRVFSELGGSSAIKSDSNSFVYNLIYSNRDEAYFIIVRGGGNSFGPTYRTYLYQNTIHYTGANSQGVICHSGCGTNILTMKNNIIWAELKAVYADGAFVESNNLYWNSSGDPFLQLANFSMSATSKIANPMFVNAGNNNFHLAANSPAINAGCKSSWTSDMDGNAAPLGGVYDLGAYESIPVAANIDTNLTVNLMFTIVLPAVSSESMNPNITC